MGDQAQGQPIYYDSDIGQYYTQAPQTNLKPNFNSLTAASLGGSLGGSLSNLNPMRIGMGGERKYLDMNINSPALQPQAPYQYADVSLASLFPMLQGGQMNQGGALDGLLSGVAQGATGQAPSQASSGAGRFM